MYVAQIERQQWLCFGLLEEFEIATIFSEGNTHFLGILYNLLFDLQNFTPQWGPYTGGLCHRPKEKNKLAGAFF